MVVECISQVVHFIQYPFFSITKQPTIIISLVIPANPYPVIEAPKILDSLVGSRITAGYQSHYVVTTLQGLPYTEANYIENQPQYDEFVIDQESQILPLFILEVDRTNCQKLAQDYQREIPRVPEFDMDISNLPEIDLYRNQEIVEISNIQSSDSISRFFFDDMQPVTESLIN